MWMWPAGNSGRATGLARQCPSSSSRVRWMAEARHVEDQQGNGGSGECQRGKNGSDSQANDPQRPTLKPARRHRKRDIADLTKVDPHGRRPESPRPEAGGGESPAEECEDVIRGIPRLRLG